MVAYMLSGASSGQRWPSQGVNQAHHTLEHSNNVNGLNIMGRFYAEMFAALLTALERIDDGNGQGAGKFQTGRIVTANRRNNNDLLISIQNASGIQSNVYGLESLCQGPIV